MDNPYEQKVFDHILKASQKKLPNINLLANCKTVENELKHIETTVQKSLENISKEPFLAIFDIWTKKLCYSHEMILDAAEDLLKYNFIKTLDSEGRIWTVEDARNSDHRKILTEIRCERKWSYKRRELLVGTYISFISWFWRESRGYISPLDDPDLENITKRSLEFRKFIDFLDAIPNEKSQLIAKLLYFGYKRTLEEVLSLKLEQIDYLQKLIHFESESIRYPEHVFHDIRAITSPRKTGHIFEGRKTATLNPKTVFRNFQDAAPRADLEIPFSIKSLTLNR